MKKILKKFFNLDFALVILNLACVISYTILGIGLESWVYYLCSGLWGISTIFNGMTWWLRYWK